MVEHYNKKYFCPITIEDVDSVKINRNLVKMTFLWSRTNTGELGTDELLINTSIVPNRPIIEPEVDEDVMWSIFEWFDANRQVNFLSF